MGRLQQSELPKFLASRSGYGSNDANDRIFGRKMRTIEPIVKKGSENLVAKIWIFVSMHTTVLFFAQAERPFATEVWLTPLILLPGVALLIVLTSARFGQVHAEFHRLLEHPAAHAKILSRSLVKRSRLFRDALACLYVSVGMFALGSLVGAFVDFFWPASVWVVGGFTVFGIGCVVSAAIQLFRESLICLDVIREHSQAIAKEGD